MHTSQLVIPTWCPVCRSWYSEGIRSVGTTCGIALAGDDDHCTGTIELMPEVERDYLRRWGTLSSKPLTGLLADPVTEEFTHPDGSKVTITSTVRRLTSGALPDKRIVWENFATGASGDIEVERTFLRRFGELYDLFCAKQRDYGRGNIAKFGTTGVMVRLSDKLERIVNLHNRGIEPSNESVRDTWRDSAIYAMIGLMCIDGDWPGTTLAYDPRMNEKLDGPF